MQSSLSLLAKNKLPNTVKDNFKFSNFKQKSFNLSSNFARNYSSYVQSDPSPYVRNGKFISRVNYGINFLPSGYKYVIETFGKFSHVANEGLNFLIPFFQKIEYVIDTKELTIEINPQKATTNDNVMVSLNGNLYLQFDDPYKAAYGAAYPVEAASKMAQSVMRTTIGGKSLDQIFKSRNDLNHIITTELQASAKAWGCVVTRFEISDLQPIDKAVVDALHKQSTAERERREKIINADAEKQKVETEANAYKFKQETEAQGDAFKIRTLAEAESYSVIQKAEGASQALKIIGETISTEEGKLAMSAQLTKEYIEKYNNLAKNSTTMIIPQENYNAGSVASMATIGGQIFANLMHGKEN